jgi:site-specific DNA-cytosine methylase
MAERPLYTLYKNLKAQNYDVPDDYNRFESALTRDGKGGADNRHAIYENLKAQNFDVPNTYERFYSALFEPRSKTSSRAKGGSVPMSAADRARFSAGAETISASAQQTMDNAGRYHRLKQRKQKQQKDFGRVNLGTHKTPYGGDANNVVKDEFAYNPETGKAGAYVTSDNENAYSLPEAEQKQAILDEQNNAYQQAVDTGEIPSALDVRDQNGNYDLQENIGKNGTYLTEEGAQKQFDKKLADAYARKKEIEALIAEDNRQHGNPLLSYGASIGAGNGRTAEQSDYRNKLATSLALVTEQIGALEAVKQYPTSSWGEDALKALDNTAFTAKTWDFGLTDFATMGQMERIKTKMDNNIPLSGSDKMLLKSKLGADAAAALEDEKMGNIYRWTKIAGQSLPFMADFFLTGGYGGITKGISRGALKFAAKRGMGKVSAAILKNTGIVAGDVIGSYAMAGTEQALKTGADIMQRHLGNLYQDEKGDYKFGTFDENGNLLHEGGESMGTALYKGLTSAMVENYTEKLFGHNYGIKKGAVNFMEKHGMNASAEFFKNIGKSGWYTNSKKWMEKFGINGFAEEVMEEEIGIPLHALLDGEGKVSDLLDTKQQLDIIGGMAISVGSMYAMGAGSRPVKGVYNRAQYYRFRNKVNVADTDAQNLMGDNWSEIKDKIDNATNEQMGSVLAGILRQRDTMSKEQINAAVNYGVNLMKLRGYNIAKTAEMNAREITNEPTTPEEQHQTDIDNAYSEGHDADDADKHDIQIQQEDQMKTLAAALGISEQQLSAMSDDELESLTGQDDKLDQAIYDYQLSSARYQGVVDDAQDKVNLAAHQAEQRVDMYTDQSRGSVRNATIKASGGLEDYGVYIISGNIATHDDGSIDVSNSDDMILYYDPTTNSVEHAEALMFAELGEELPADDVKAQAIADAKENAIKEIAGIIDGTVEVGSQFNVTDTDGAEHTYEVLADYGDGTAAISIDGNVVENPYSLADLQQMKDLEDQKRLEAAKAEREQMEKERAAQQNQETEETQPSFDFNQILNDNGNVVLVDVLDKDGNTKYPDSRLFLIRDAGAKAKVVELKSDGTIVPHAVNKEDVATISSMSLDEYKQAMPESSMIEDNSGEESDEDSRLANLGLPKGSEVWMSGDGFGRPKENTLSKVVGIDEQGSIILEDKDGKKWSASFDYINNHRELPPLDENTNIVNEENNQSESNAEENTPAPEQTPAITLEDGTEVPMLEDGNPDFSKLTAAQTAELYDSQFGEDADSIVSGYVSDAKKALDKASNMTVKGKTFVEQKAAKDAKEKAIADAQAAYDSAIAIRDAYNERQLAKVEDTAEGRKELIEKARRKFARLKSAVKDDAEAVSQLYRDTIGSLLHSLYDGTGIDVTDTIPLTAEEYVASNLGAHTLNYEGTETSKGVKQETGLSREDFAKTQLLAADGKGTTIDALVHSLWENRPSNLESLDTQDIRNALIGVLNSGFKASEARNFVENIRIAQAENILEEQKRAQENAAYAEQPEAESEAELKAKSDEKAELKAKSEAKLDNESDNESNDLSNETDNEQKNDNINDNINVPEDATDEAPLGAQRDESDLPFSAKENGKQKTTAERAADVEKNKVDDMKVVDNIVGEKTRKTLEKLAKMMGANVQWQYSDKNANGWFDDKTNTIYLTLDSSITECVQFIFGHEMTHEMRTKNPAAYDELKTLVKDMMGEDAFNKETDRITSLYNENNVFYNGGRTAYEEEVVADQLGSWIRDANYAHTLLLKMSHPLLARLHEIVNRFLMALHGTEFSDDMNLILRSIEQAYVKTANGQVTNSETGEDVSFSLRQKPEPKKKGIGYKVFVLKDGKLYPPMVANPDGAATPVGVWLDADAAPIAGESKTGRPQVKQGGKGTQGGSGKLAYRPGWHLGIVPYAIQFNRKDADGNKTLFPKNFVFAEVEYAADVDYQEEARQEGINPSGKYQHSLAGLKHLPTDGYYMYRTNPNPETDPWVITGAMKVNRILTRAEQAELVKNAGREPQQIQEGDIVTDDVVNSINQEIADAPKFSLKSKPVRYEAGKKLSDEEKKEVLSTLTDAYKVNGVPYHIEETAGGKEKRVYEPTADSYVVSDITNRPLRYYITLPDGRVAHPTEVYPNISDNEVKSSATKQGLLDDEADQIVSAAIGNMKGIADNAKVLEVLTEMQNLPHETHDVGYGMNNAQSYNYKTGIFTSDAAQAIDYVVRRMRRKEDVPAEIPAALKKAVDDSYGMVDNLIDGMSNTKVGAAEIKPVGVGAFGNIYNQFRGKAKAAIEFLKKVRGGEAVGALYHKDIGDIDLVWGKEGTGHSDGYGLSKLVKYHPEVLDNLQEILNDMRVVSSSKNRVNLESETHKAGVRLTWDGERKSWLLTAFKKETSASDKRTDTAATSLEGDTALSQTEGSAAKIDNSSETTKKNGEKFSLKDEKTMFGMHNISVDKLRKAIKQGGFAAPSMGVVDSKNGIYSDYGEITLIPKAEKLAKRTGKNAGTFTADAWTPTYPQVERIMNKQGEKAFNTDMNVKLGDVDNGIYSNVRESWKGYLSSGDVRDGLYWHYLFDKGMNPETIYQTGKYDNDITNEVMRISDNGNKTDYTDKEVAELIQLMNKATGKDNDVDAQREKLKARIASAEKQGNHLLVALKKKRLEELEGVENFYIAADFVNDVVRNNRKNGKVDVHDTMGAAKKKVEDNKKLSDDFPSWLDKKTEEYGVEEMLYNGTTPSGKPKYIPNTIDNAVKLMKKQGVAGGYTAFGSELGVFIAKNSPEVNTLAAMKNAKDKLIPFGDERHNQIKDKITKEFLELSDEIRVGSNNRYAFDDSGVSRMVELTDHKGNEKEYLKKAYNIEVSDEWMDRYNKLLDTIKKDYKVFYFETKFMRPYGLDEFEKAIVPSDTPSDVIDALKKAGIDVSSYERGNAEDRQKVTMDAINSSDNIRFSLAGERGAAAADKAEERTFRMDNLSVARKMEEKKKDAKAIKMATGWERGADGKWRYEMPDAKIKDTMDVGGGHIVKRYEDDMLWNGGKLFDVIDAPELFKAYPQLKGVRIDTDAIMNDMPSHGEYDSKTNTITIHADELKYMNDILNHEIQHAIQGIEGFAKGGSPRLVRGEVKKRFDEVTKQIKQLRAEGKEDEAKALIEKNRGLYNAYTKNDDFNSYKSLAGEVEARNVQERMNMTPEERRKTLAESTEDVARKDQIFLGVGDVSFSLRDMADGKESGAADMAEDLKSLNTPDEVDDAIKTAIDDMPSGWKMANKKMIHIVQALGENRKAEIAGEEPKFSLKDGTLIKAGTYFSGGGLVEEGLKGIIDPVVAVEYDEKISGVYRNNFGQHIVTADVRDVDPKELVKQIDGEVEYFHASPVCKNYSQAKSNHAEVELDKETAASTAEFINAVKPKVVTIENVKGYKDSDAMKIITDVLDANGYTWDADVYNAADYGGYTNRERLIVRAVRDGKLPEKPKKMARKSGWYEAVADIIPTLTEKKNGVAPWMDIRLKADGIDWRNIDKPLYVMGSAYADGKIPHAFADELLPTLRTKSGDVIVMPDGKVYRAMGRVLARVSGVSDDYKMPFSENLSHIIIGNGIPTQLTEHVIAPLLQNTLRPTTPEDGNTKFSLRYDKFEHDLNQWKKDNNLPKDAQRPTIPQRNAGESAVDFLRRVDEYRKQMALWKTAPTYEQHLLSDDTALGEFNRELQRGSVLKRIAFQDSMLAIRKAQEAIMNEVGVDRLNMAEDAYTAENRSHGKGKNEFEEYNNEFLQPLRKAYHQMKKILGDSYDNVRIYMMAKHGLERDAQMAFKKSLEADYEDVAQRSAAYRAYKGDMNRITNDSDLEFGRVDFNTWRQRDNALRTKYSPSYMDYRYDENGIAYDYSGLSALFGGSDFEEAAHKLVRDIESSHVAEVQDLWNATNAATKKILRDGYKAGMMSKDTYQYVRDMYSHYIPLRGWDGTTADQVWDYVGGGKGAFNQTLKTAHGRTSIADDPIAYIENMAESGILLNNKNWVKQHLMLLAQNHPTSLLTLSKAWYVKSTDANGNEEWIPATPQITSQMNSNQVKAAIDAFEKKMEQMAQTGDATQKRDGLNIAYPQTNSEEREHEVRVMKDGEEYVIYVNGDPQLAQAMNNTRAHRVREIQSGKLDRAAAWLGRKMAAAYTSLSPLFIPSNYFRDLTMTLASTAIREDAKYNYLLRKNLATSWNLGFMLKDYQNGKLREKVNNGNATPKEQMFYDFMMNGGETGFVSSLDVEDLKKKFKNDLKDLDRWKANPVKVGHTIMDGIEFLNRAIEDSNRFAVYMTSIQYGRSIDEAVNDAKDVTLNFNRKGTGEYGWQMIRNLYLFINPAVQSLQTLGALVKHHPFKFTAVTASWLASGVLVPIVNAALMSLLGGDDDKDKYWQFTKWDRRNNLIMWVPFTHEYIKIPLAQEFRAFYGIGDMIASKMMGGELAEESWSQYAEDLLGQVVDMLPLDPTGYDGNIAVSLMPNAIRPVFELAFNVDFTGKPLFKDTEYNKYDPNFTKAYVGTPDWLVRASRMVNSIGNDYPDVQQNSIDAFGDPRYNLNNPAVVDHVLSSYLGGAYTMGSQVLGVLTKSLNDPKEIKVADIPLFSKFVSNPDDRPVTKKQGDEFWDMKENHDRAANTLSKLKKQAKVDGDYSMLERFYGSEEYKQYKQDDVKVKKYEEDKKKERAEESGEEYRPHKLNAEDIYKAHATPKDDFEDLKLKQLYTKLNGFKSAYDLLVDTAPSQSDGYYNTNKVAIDAIDEISLDKQEISELKKGFLDDGKDAYNAEDMKQIRELRKKILSVLEKANKVVVANQKAKTEK